MSESARPEGTGAPAGASGTPSPASKPAASSAPRQGSYVRTVLKVLTGSATAQAIPLLAMLLFTRMVSVEALGIYAIWQAVIYIAIVPATARMEVLLVALPLASDRRLAFRIGMATSIGVGVLLSLIAMALQTLIQAQLPGWPLSASVLVGLGTWALAMQTLWSCADVEIKNVCARGDYFAMNCENVRVYGLNLDGNYGFDSCKNVLVEDSKLLSKDAFWNCENVTVRNSFISGEYLAWNSKNVTFENCVIESLQGLCYVQNLVLRGCQTLDTTLAFEYSSVDVEILGGIASVKNPLSGVIRAREIGEIIMDEECVDPATTRIILEK